jgi:hypothetical protein
MALTRRTTIAGVAALALTGSILAYLRDPAWLATVESGFHRWQVGADGTRYRWTDGHASFFVPAFAKSVTLPLRVTFEQPGDPPVLVNVALDDRPADAFELRDDRWVERRIIMPPPAGRRHRRIDIRVDRLRAGSRGVQLAEIVVQTR